MLKAIQNVPLKQLQHLRTLTEDLRVAYLRDNDLLPRNILSIMDNMPHLSGLVDRLVSINFRNLSTACKLEVRVLPEDDVIETARTALGCEPFEAVSIKWGGSPVTEGDHGVACTSSTEET